MCVCVCVCECVLMRYTDVVIDECLRAGGPLDVMTLLCWYGGCV